MNEQSNYSRNMFSLLVYNMFFYKNIVSTFFYSETTKKQTNSLKTLTQVNKRKTENRMLLTDKTANKFIYYVRSLFYKQ